MPKEDIRHSEYPHCDSHQFKPFKVTLFQVEPNLWLPIEYKLSRIDKIISQTAPNNDSQRQYQCSGSGIVIQCNCQMCVRVHTLYMMFSYRYPTHSVWLKLQFSGQF